MNVLELSEQEIIRRNSLNELRAMGIEPYPAAEYVTNAFSTDIKAEFKDDEEPRKVSVAGRMMSRRVMGKASFIELQDSKGRIQIYITRDDICPDENKEMYNTVFKRLLDLGDFIGIEGFVFRTQMGEISIHAKKLTVLSKSIKPLPIVKYKDGVAYDKFEDPELRYRQRYVDLAVNEEIKDIFIKRSKVYSSMREYFNSKGYMEVETPILQSIAGGAAARPFITHHNALDMPLYMRIASELYLKRLIVGGFEGVYEIGKNFRNEGMDRTHNPEFTCMEIYVAYKDYNWMMEFTEKMIEKIVRKEVELQEGVKLYSVPDARMSDEELREAIGSWDSIWEEPAAEMCQDIDVEPGIKTLILGGFDEFCFYPEEKVFPDVVEIHICKDVSCVALYHKAFPNVRKITSESPYFLDSDMLVRLPDDIADMVICDEINKQDAADMNRGILENVFCRRPDEVLDLNGIKEISVRCSFSGCETENIINTDNVTNCWLGSFYWFKPFSPDKKCDVESKQKKDYMIGTILVMPYIESGKNDEKTTYIFPDKKITAIAKDDVGLPSTRRCADTTVVKNESQIDAIMESGNTFAANIATLGRTQQDRTVAAFGPAERTRIALVAVKVFSVIFSHRSLVFLRISFSFPVELSDEPLPG